MSKQQSVYNILAKAQVRKVEFGKLDDVRAMAKEILADKADVEKMKAQVISKYVKANQKAEQLLKEQAFALDMATEMGLTQVIGELQKSMAETRKNISYNEQQIQKLKG